jgi:SAM-dependent methyltransferase
MAQSMPPGDRRFTDRLAVMTFALRPFNLPLRASHWVPYPSFNDTSGQSMPADNSEQIADWNGMLGQRWVAMQREIDRIVVPFGDAALKVAAPQPGERVIDIGCGCGDTSIEIARVVGEAGAVLGIDVSQPMLEVARSRGAGYESHVSCLENSG